MIHRDADLRHRFLILLDGTEVGVLSISNLVRGPFQSANLGYWVAQEVNGRGVGTRAVGEACRWAFGPGGLHRLEAGTLTDNIASQRVLERNGFERIGLAPSVPAHRGKLARPHPVPADRAVSVRLRPLREDEYADFLERSRREYAGGSLRERVADAGGGDREGGAGLRQLLPEGTATPGQTIFAIEQLETGERVGRLWFAEREMDGQRVAFLYDIAIDEPHRGRGLGRAAMLAFEQVAMADGHEVLELNVFGGNARARGLFRSLGFVETAVHMQKQLATDR